jgi:hypothetical protein
MRLSRRWLVGLVALALACALLALAVAPADPIGPAGYPRIREGMSRDEVQAIMGRPPGLYYGGSRKSVPYAIPTRSWGVAERGGEGFTHAGWWGDRQYVYVYFDRDGKVAGASPGDVVWEDSYPSFARRLRNWLVDLRARIGL